MKMPKYSFMDAKDIILKNVGKEINFTSKISRGKIITDTGIILNAYNNIFTIQTKKDGKENVISFSYNDIVNNNLSLSTAKAQNN